MKNVGVPETPLRSAVSTSSAIRGALAPPQIFAKALEIETELLGVAEQILTFSSPDGRATVVHLPELPLRARRLGRLGGQLGVGVDVVER